MKSFPALPLIAWVTLAIPAAVMVSATLVPLAVVTLSATTVDLPADVIVAQPLVTVSSPPLSVP